MATETLPFLPDVEEDSTERTEKSYLPLYRVIMWNDDVTTMEFVIRVLTNHFSKSYDDAEQLMMEIHLKGAAHVATLPLETAEFKVDQVHNAALLEQFPFTCTIEPV